MTKSYFIYGGNLQKPLCTTVLLDKIANILTLHGYKKQMYVKLSFEKLYLHQL